MNDYKLLTTAFIPILLVDSYKHPLILRHPVDAKRTQGKMELALKVL